MKKLYLSLAVLFLFILNLSLASADFQFNGTVRDESGRIIPGCGVAGSDCAVDLYIYDISNAYVGINTTTVTSSGQFNLTVSENAGPPWRYGLSIEVWNDTLTSIDYVSKPLPDFPKQMMQQLSGGTFYLARGGYISLSAVNSSGDPVNFNYQVKDMKLAYPVADNFGSSQVSSVGLYNLPSNRNYTIMIYPQNSMPISFEWNNFSSNISYTFDGGNSSYNVTNRKLAKKFNLTNSMPRVSGYINYTGIAGWNNFTVVPFLVEPGNIIHSVHGAMPYNMSAFGGGGPPSSDLYNLTTGFFNISLPATVERSSILLFAVAINGSNYYGGFRNISLRYADYPTGGQVQDFNFTQMAGLLGTAGNIEMDKIAMGPPQKINISTLKQTFNLVNESNVAMANVSGHIEIKVDYSAIGSYAFTWVAGLDMTGGLANFAVPLLNSTGVKEINVFLEGGTASGQYSPRRISFTVSQLLSSSNITIKTFNPQTLDNSTINGERSVQLDMIVSNSTCDVPNPPANCYLTPVNATNMSNFNPLQAVMGGGKISFRMGVRHVFVHYVNVDLLASGPPEALFDSKPNRSSQSGGLFSSALRFGSTGPTIYDYVLVSIPYTDINISQSGGLNDSAVIRVTLPIFYDENWNAIWNTSSNGTNSGALIGNYSHYAAREAEWSQLMEGSNCTTGILTSALQINATNPCYVDNVSNRIWIRLPHFSGSEPQVDGGSYSAPTSAGTIDFKAPTDISGTNLTRNWIYVNVTANLTGTLNLSVYFFNTSGIMFYNSTTNTGLFLNYTNLPDGVYIFNATVANDTGPQNQTETRIVTIDTTAPIYQSHTNNSPKAYSASNQTLNFTVTYLEAGVGLSNGTLIFNGSNYTMSKLSASTFNVTISRSLSVGTYNYSFWANDSLRNSNQTAQFVFNVTQATPTLTILANGNAISNLTLIYPQIINITATTTGGTIGIDRNSTDVSAENSTNVSLAAGGYLYRFNVTGNENYTNVSYSYYSLIVNQGSGLITLLINNSATGIAISANTNLPINATLNVGSGNISVYVTNGTLTWIYNGTSPAGNNSDFNYTGRYNITAIYLGNTNYTAYSTTSWVDYINTLNDTIATTPTISVTPNISKIIVNVNTTLQNVTIPSTSTQSVNLDLSLIKNVSGNVTIPNNFTLTRVSTSVNYTAIIPLNTTIIGGSSWDGNITLPIVNATTFTAPSSGTTNVVIDVGSSTELNFSKAVKIIIGGMAGKKAAWSRGTTALTAITTQCTSSSNHGIDSTTVRECYEDSGSDLVIWTYHFTSFAAYTPLVNVTTTTTTTSDGAGSVPYNIGEISESSSVERTAKESDTISFKVAGTAYTATVGAVTADSAVITLLGEATTLSIDSYKRYDLDDDGTYDLEVSLESVTGTTTKYAKFKFKKITMVVEAAPGEETPAEEGAGAAEETPTEEGGAAGLLTEISKLSPTWLLTISIVVVIAVIIIFLVVPRLMKKKY